MLGRTPHELSEEPKSVSQKDLEGGGKRGRQTHFKTWWSWGMWDTPIKSAPKPTPTGSANKAADTKRQDDLTILRVLPRPAKQAQSVKEAPMPADTHAARTVFTWLPLKACLNGSANIKGPSGIMPMPPIVGSDVQTRIVAKAYPANIRPASCIQAALICGSVEQNPAAPANAPRPAQEIARTKSSRSSSGISGSELDDGRRKIMSFGRLSLSVRPASPAPAATSRSAKLTRTEEYTVSARHVGQNNRLERGAMLRRADRSTQVLQKVWPHGSMQGTI